MFGFKGIGLSFSELTVLYLKGANESCINDKLGMTKKKVSFLKEQQMKLRDW